MRVHLVKKQTLEDFIINHSESSVALWLWMSVLKGVQWDTPGDILKTFPAADLLGNGSERVIFNIAGNKYRMICHYVFGGLQVHLFVCWIGTHAGYSKLCKGQKQYTISQF
ncbi:MAG: type II toxin-antitoxin system HigB family toxin [Flavitalea sp.]